MSLYSFYCDEQMLLDNWSYYKEPNRLLKNILKKTDLSPTECASIYYEKMNNPESVTYDREILIRYFKDKKNTKQGLFRIKQIVLYDKDINYIENAKRDYHLNQTQVEALFGVIFFCRMYNVPKLFLNTQFRLNQFSGCFKKRLHVTYMNGNTWYDGYNTITGLPVLSDQYGLLLREFTDGIGCNYTYPNFELSSSDKIAYTYKVTKETNLLNLAPVAVSLFDPHICYCKMCKNKYYTVKPNGSLYCKKCAAEKEKKRLMMAYKNKSKSRDKKHERNT